MASKKGYIGINGRKIDTLKEGAIPKITAKGICTSPGWIEVRVCDGGVALRRKIL